MLTVADAIPPHWTALLKEAPVGLGLDLATTEKGTSNPSSLTVGQRWQGRFYARLVLAWKTADPDVTEAIVKLVLDQLHAVNVRPRRLGVDASNERFFATSLRKTFGGRVIVDLIAGNDKLKHRGTELDAKTLLGNLWASALEDGLVVLPVDEFIATDYRLVKREAGGFVTETGKGGEHGDCFDSGKLAYWALEGQGGPVSAEPLNVGSYDISRSERPGIRNRLMRRARQNILPV